MDKEQYDEEPVYYCKRCLSLRIKSIPFIPNSDYCADCNAADVGEAPIEEWKALYRKKHGHDFVEKKIPKWPYWC